MGCSPAGETCYPGHKVVIFIIAPSALLISQLMHLTKVKESGESVKHIKSSRSRKLMGNHGNTPSNIIATTNFLAFNRQWA